MRDSNFGKTNTISSSNNNASFIRKANNFYGYGSVLSRDGISRAISPDKSRMSGISRGGMRSPQALRDNNIILNSPEAIEVERRYTKIL
jgi:hypothetical protein